MDTVLLPLEGKKELGLRGLAPDCGCTLAHHLTGKKTPFVLYWYSTDPCHSPVADHIHMSLGRAVRLPRLRPSQAKWHTILTTR
jgi:hypothetical protein